MTADPIPLRGHAGAPDVAGDHLNAQRFLHAHGHSVRRSPELGQWFVWNGSWWEEDRLDRVLEMATGIVNDLRQWAAEATNADDFKRRSAHYQASAKAGRREALLAVAGTHPEVVVSVDQLDAHPMLLACQSGTVDLTTGEFRAADRADLITKGIGVGYDPDVGSEDFERFLATIFDGDADLIAYVQRLLGYCLTGVVAEHVLSVFFGHGANGKSVLVGVVQDLLGDFAITAPEGLIIQHGREHPERLAVLRGRRLVVSAELEEQAVLAEGMVKMLTGGDTISARQMYGHRFNFAPTHKVLLVTNHRPRVHGVDHAIWRRIRVVPFGVTIPAEDQDPTLRRRLVEEHGTAVLSWLVRGAVAWHRDGIGTAPAVDEATDDYRHSQDRLAAWLDERTVRVESVVTKAGDLYGSWKAWIGDSPGRLQDFVADLEAHGIRVESKGRNRLARGIALKVRAQEGSLQTFPIQTPTGSLSVSPHEPSSAPPLSDDELLRMFGDEG
jgi:putative DNA primase/helicase